MKRGSTEHVHNDARQLLNSDFVKQYRERVQEKLDRRLRSASLADAEDCIASIATYQAFANMWAAMESDARQVEAESERKVPYEVV